MRLDRAVNMLTGCALLFMVKLFNVLIVPKVGKRTNKEMRTGGRFEEIYDWNQNDVPKIQDLLSIRVKHVDFRVLEK